MKNACGNAALEMLLCTPIALFFLFAVTDTGLTFIQSAGLRDAIRAGIAAEARSGKEAPALTLNESGEFVESSRADLADTARRIAQSIEANVLQSKVYGVNDANPMFEIEVTPVMVGINAETGKLELDSIEVGAAVRSPASVSAAALDCAQEQPGDFVTAQLGANQGELPSRYAVPAGFTFGGGSAQAVFVPKGLFFHVRTRVLPGSINAGFVAGILGKPSVMCDQQLAEARNFAH